MISGVDYVINTQVNNHEIVETCKAIVNAYIWDGGYYDIDDDDGVVYLFCSKSKDQFDTINERGFFIESDGEGPFLIISSEHTQHITLVLPAETKTNPFCARVHELIQQALR